MENLESLDIKNQQLQCQQELSGQKCDKFKSEAEMWRQQSEECEKEIRGFLFFYVFLSFVF